MPIILPSFARNVPCWIEINFCHWSDIFIVVGLSYLWNLSLIIWALPWNAKQSFPYLGSSLFVMFQSDRYGISIQNWRNLGNKRAEEAEVSIIAKTNAFKFFAFIFTLNSYILFAAKFSMFLTLNSRLYIAWNAYGFVNFFNIEIALVTLLLMSNMFFTMPILPYFQMASKNTSFVLCCLYLLYAEMVLTAILLCIQYPLLISVLYIGACIILTGMVLGMAIICLLIIIAVAGTIIFWTLNIVTLLRYTSYIRWFSASLTWLYVTYLVWVAGICLSFLFTTSEFDSVLCIAVNGNDLYQSLSFIFVSVSIVISIVSVCVLKWAFQEQEEDQYYMYPYEPI